MLNESIKCYTLENLANDMGLKIGDKVKIYYRIGCNDEVKGHLHKLNEKYIMVPLDYQIHFLDIYKYSLNYYIGYKYEIIERDN